MSRNIASQRANTRNSGNRRFLFVRSFVSAVVFFCWFIHIWMFFVFFYVCDSHNQRVRQINNTNIQTNTHKNTLQRRIWHWHNYRVASFRCVCVFVCTFFLVVNLMISLLFHAILILCYHFCLPVDKLRSILVLYKCARALRSLHFYS